MATADHILPCPASASCCASGSACPSGVLAVLAMIVLPLPPIALDVLFTFNIALSIVIVMAVFYVARPIEFGVFPTVLLLATLLRLALNVASTRVVLLHGHTGPAGRRSRHPGLRRVRDRRQLRRRRGGVRHPDHHQLRGGHQGLGPHLRSQRALHPGRDARQADGDRRRPERRPDHPGRSARAPRSKCARRPTSTARWTVPASSSAATPSPAS